MAVSIRVYVAVLLVMIHVYVGPKCRLNGHSGFPQSQPQGYSGSVSEYLTCVKNALKDCGSNAEDTLKKAEEQMAQHECSSAGVPVISVLCLLIAAIVLVLYQ
ncbi:uncharacterized protein LOC128155657 [Crassostrea angulata]|uniref:uncharacterized protein LOC128155657 n=1 Tax=Magallana angulata TaxID=2784310 RepID=UPI0022B13DE9|nr:uncharacterized protein LOC128155657 [Crassostrea angulata]